MKYTVLYLRVPSTALSRCSLELYIPAFTGDRGIYCSDLLGKSTANFRERVLSKFLRDVRVRTCSLRPCISRQKLVAFSLSFSFFYLS